MSSDPASLKHCIPALALPSLDTPLTEDDVSFDQQLGQEWASVIAKPATYDALLASGLIPLVVEANNALLRALEAEANADTVPHPSTKPRRRIQPLHFIASYLMRNNPKHDKKSVPASSARDFPSARFPIATYRQTVLSTPRPTQ